MESNVNTIPKVLRRFAEEYPEKSAFVFVDKHFNKITLSRKDVWDKSRKFAAILHRHGIKKGDIVCNNLLNTPERVITDFGCMVAGASPLHGQFILLNGEDLIRNLQTSECKAIILDSKQKHGAGPIIEALKYTDNDTGETQHKGLPHLKLVLDLDVFVDEDVNAEEAASRPRFLNTLDKEDEVYEDETLTEKDRAIILITSGTTGLAKLVVHLHRTVIEMGRLMNGCLQAFNNPSACHYNDRSLGWVAGVPIMFLATGITRVATDLSCGAPPDIGPHILRVLTEIECDASLLLSFEISKLMQLLAGGQVVLKRKLPMVITGGGPLPRALLSCLDVLCDCLGIVYASTECGFMSAQRVTDKTEYEDNCVGTSTEIVTLKVVDENLQPVSANRIGEILIQSPTRAEGYLNNPQQTKADFLSDGWFRPGDIVRMNENGQVFVYCRKSNAISKFGVIIYPGWVETQINKCPGLLKSVAVGIPDPVAHNEIALCVVRDANSNLTEEAVMDFCKRTFVSNDKDPSPSVISCIPKHILFFDTVPLSANGKVNRKSLKVEVCKRLGIA